MNIYNHVQCVLERLDQAAIELNGRFQALRQVGFGCVNLFVLALACIFHQMADAYEQILHCIQQTANRLIDLVQTLRKGLSHRYHASKDFIVAQYFIILDAGAHAWSATTQRIAHLMRPRAALYISLATASIAALWLPSISQQASDIWADDDDCEPCPDLQDGFHFWKMVIYSCSQALQNLQDSIFSLSFNPYLFLIIAPFTIACCFLLEAVIAYNRDVVQDRFLRTIPSRDIFHISPQFMFLVVYFFGVWVPSLLPTLYGTSMTTVLDLTISTLITIGMIIMQLWNSFLRVKDKVWKHLDYLLYFVPAGLIAYLFVDHTDSDTFRIRPAIDVGNYIFRDRDVTSRPHISIAVPSWLRNPYVAALCIILVGPILGKEFHAACSKLVGLLKRAVAFAKPRRELIKIRLLSLWTAIRIYMSNARASLSQLLKAASPQMNCALASILNWTAQYWPLVLKLAASCLLIAAWPSIRDSDNISSITSAFAASKAFSIIPSAYDVNLLSILYSCMQYLSPARIWIARNLIRLGETLEGASFNGMQWFWISEFVWLDACMVAALNAAFFYTGACWYRKQ